MRVSDKTLTERNMKIEIPNDADMPAALAKLMGWTLEPNNGTGGARDKTGKFRLFGDGQWINCWSPMTCRNSSRLAVEECVRLGLISKYIVHCRQAWFRDLSDTRDLEVFLICLTPAQESRAAYLTLAEYHQKKEKP